MKFPGAQGPRARQNPYEIEIKLFRGTTLDESLGFWRQYMLRLETWLRSFYQDTASAEGDLEKRRHCLRCQLACRLDHLTQLSPSR